MTKTRYSQVFLDSQTNMSLTWRAQGDCVYEIVSALAEAEIWITISAWLVTNGLANSSGEIKASGMMKSKETRKQDEAAGRRRKNTGEEEEEENDHLPAGNDAATNALEW